MKLRGNTEAPTCTGGAVPMAAAGGMLVLLGATGSAAAAIGTPTPLPAPPAHRPALLGRRCAVACAARPSARVARSDAPRSSAAAAGAAAASGGACRGSWDEPVIILEADASLVGTPQGNQDRWRLRASATGADAIQWELGSGILLQGTRQSPEIVVRYGLGRHAPVLVARKMIAGRVYAAKAAIHHLLVLEQPGGSHGPTELSPPAEVADPFGSRGTASRLPNDDLKQTSLAIWLHSHGSSRLRLSADGYPQNEYWLGPADAIDPPLRLALTAAGQSRRLFVQGYGEPSQMVDDAQIQAHPTAQPGLVPLGEAQLSTVRLDIALDRNGDQQISFGEDDRTSWEQPYQFWINNDRDRVGDHWKDHIGTYSEEDDYQSGPRDHEDERISCRRDLEDVSRLWLRWTSSATAGLLLNQGVDRVRVRAEIIGIGGIRCFPGVTAEGTGYLTDYRGAAQRARTLTSVLVAQTGQPGTGTIEYRLSDWHYGIGQTTTLLWEGTAIGRSQVRFRAEAELPSGGWIPLGSATCHLDLRDITAFYDLLSLGQNPGAISSRITYERRILVDREPDNTDYVLHVHGWNMEPWEKERFGETAFKRLWWNGYRGGFGVLVWPTDYRFDSTSKLDIATKSDHFDRSEYTAWQSGAVLAQGLPGVIRAVNANHPIVLSAHSMGNIVVGNALQRLSPLTRGKIQAFIACQAAVTGHVFDGSLQDPLTRFGIYGIIDEGPTTANVYPNVLAAVRSYPTYNFFNVDDYALSDNAWQINQATKPNNGYHYIPGASPISPGPGFIPEESEWENRWLRNISTQISQYRWNIDVTTPPEVAEFIAIIQSASPRKKVVPIDPPDSRYHIMSFMSEPRIQAAGAAERSWTVEPDNPNNPRFRVNLESVWPDYKLHRHKSATINEDLNPYSGHRWHSAQYRMTIAEQAAFWQMFIDRAFNSGRSGYLSPVERGRDP